MSVLNTEGLSLFGPGSEWFWSMLQFLVVAVTLLGIYSQLRVSQSANAFAQLDTLEHELRGERLTRRRLRCLIALRDEGPAADLDEAVGCGVASVLGEDRRSLARVGHLETSMLTESIGGDCEAWWAILEPSMLRDREADGDPTLWTHFEWLAGEMDRLGRRQGVEPYLTREFLLDPVRLADQITALDASLRDLEAERSVIVQPREPTPEATPPAPAKLPSGARPGSAPRLTDRQGLRASGASSCTDDDQGRCRTWSLSPPKRPASRASESPNRT